MSSTRREFIKQLGIALASLAVARCAPWNRDTQGTGRGKEAATARERLRDIWQQFDQLAARTQRDADRGAQLQESLIADHRSALDDLVALGELSEAVAGRVQVAYEAAAAHIWRANAPITCYEPVLVDYRPVTSGQLVKQAEILAGHEDLDPQVRAHAQDAIARDVAFLNLPPAQVEALYQEILDRLQGGLPTPAFEQVDLEVSPEDLEAAAFLVELLLGSAL